MLNSETIETLKLQIDEYITHLSKPEHIFSGSIFVSVDGVPIVNKGYGMANYELSVPNTPTTKYSIGSITKQFTALIILQLIEKGLLQLDDMLDKFIEDYPNGSSITVHHLLTHSSGIYNYTKDEDLPIYMRKYHTLDELIGKFKNTPLDFEPGVKYSYSNSGYILLGYIIEKVTNKTYEEYVQANIFDKLSMNNSGYNDHVKLIKNRANGYDLEEDKIQNCDFIYASVPYASGSLYSTIEDLHLWNTALFHGNIISKEYSSKIIDNHTKIAENFYYGYGTMVWSREYGKKVRKGISHDGGTPGFVASNNIFPEDNVEIIILSNLTNDAKDKISLKLREIIFGIID